MNEICFTDFDTMKDAIMAHTAEHRSYVIAYSNVPSQRRGWLCPVTETYFYMHRKCIRLMDYDYRKRVMESSSVRQKCEMILSNCRNEEQFESLKKRVSNLKAFW